MTKINKLFWTEEMRKVHSTIVNSPLNEEQHDLKPKAVKVLSFGGYSFFLYLPICVAGWSAPADSYRVIKEGEHLIENELPSGSELVAWYGWGGSGWIAQVRPRVDDSEMREALAKLVGLDTVPEIDPNAIEKLDGLLDDLIGEPIDCVQIIKEARSRCR
ncbi:MAG: hypothetical protein KAT53_03145 [Dehalococcoidia bacterium]|nr:hypothetical protein [Dehalococcoidia bacterium]